MGADHRAGGQNDFKPYSQLTTNVSYTNGALNAPGGGRMVFNADVANQSAQMAVDYGYGSSSARGTKAKWSLYARFQRQSPSIATYDYTIAFMTFGGKTWKLRIHWDTNKVQVEYDGTYVTSGGTYTWSPTVGSGGAGTTYRIEWLVDNASSGGSSSLWIDGTLIFTVSQNGNGSGLSINGTNATGLGAVWSGGGKTDSFGIQMETDHEILIDNQAGYGANEASELLVSVQLLTNSGPAAVYTPCVPTGDSATYNAWRSSAGGAHYLDVDETGLGTDAAYNVANQTDGDVRQYYTHAAATSFGAASSDLVIGVKTKIVTSVTITSFGSTYKYGSRIGTDIDEHSLNLSVVVDDQYDGIIWPLAPNGAPWTQAKFNASEFGVHFVYGSGSDEVRLQRLILWFAYAVGKEPPVISARSQGHVM